MASRRQKIRFNRSDVARELKNISQDRVSSLARDLEKYITENLPKAFERRKHIGDYRTNPYVLMTSASIMNLTDHKKFANFLFNNKLYAGLETSFGKQVESILLGNYPIGSKAKWGSPQEKIDEFELLKGLDKEARANQRNDSEWREIDASVMVDNHRYLVSIKSGPNCINDSQVEAMQSAIGRHRSGWWRDTKRANPNCDSLDVVIGITYGTYSTTNNKENQILTKLQRHGFVSQNADLESGIYIDGTKKIKAYHKIGKDFWSFIGNPKDPSKAQFVYLEVLLGLAKALKEIRAKNILQEPLNKKIQDLGTAILELQFEEADLPSWLQKEFSNEEMVWLASAITAFYDNGV